MKLETKSKRISAVVSLKDYKGLDLWQGLKTAMDEIGAVRYAYILHSKDLKEDGTPKTPHIHIYAETTASGKRLGTYLNEIARCLGVSTLAVSVEKPNDPEACIQYLIHKNAPEKHQYELKAVHSNIPFEELETIMEREVTAWSVDYIRAVWLQCRPCKWKFIKEIGIERYRLYSRVIMAVLDDLAFR